jgi:uncharacterized protein
MTGWILRVILFLIVLRLVLRFVVGLVQGFTGSSGRSASGAAHSGGNKSGQLLVRDPVCGTYVPRSTALRIGSGPSTLYFCSEDCREAYGKHA